MQRVERTTSIVSVVGIAIFLIAISAPLVRSVLKQDQEYSKSEKRLLAQLPSPPKNTDELVSYPNRFDDYYADQFGYRKKLNSRYIKLMSYFTSRSAVKDVTLGQDGWLFLGSPRPSNKGNDNPFGDARHIEIYSQEDLEVAAAQLEKRRDWLKSQNIEYIYTVAPNKHTIYFDKLPKNIKKEGPRSGTDQLLGYLKENTDVTVVDLRPALLEKRKTADVYFKYDTHWNLLGANLAQYDIMLAVNKLVPDSYPARLFEDNEFEFRAIDKPGDLSAMVQLEKHTEVHPLPRLRGLCLPIDRSTEQDLAKMRKVTTCDKGRKSALVYRDSFGDSLQLYFSRQFEVATYVWKQSDFESLYKEIAIRKPDVVIEEVVERVLPYIPSDKGFPENIE